MLIPVVDQASACGSQSPHARRRQWRRCSHGTPALPPRLPLLPSRHRSSLLAALDELAERVAGAEQSTALIFFAGHGEPAGASYALLPHDALLTNLAATGITAEVFHERVAQVRARARRLVVLLNCCHAGGVGDEVLGGLGDETPSGAAPPPEFYRPLVIGSGQVVISSSRPGQKPGARSRHNPQHTTFGAHLLEALRGAAPGAGAGVGVFDLFAHLRTAVPPDACHIPYLGKPLVQEPLFYANQLDDNIPVALRPAGSDGVLGTHDSLIARLIALELEIEALGEAVPAELRANRDAVLTRFERGQYPDRA